MLTLWFPSGDRLSGPARLARSGVVDGHDAELVRLSLFQIRNGELGTRSGVVINREPIGRALLAFFDDVTGDGPATVISGRSPFEIDGFRTVIRNFWGAGSIGCI